MCCKNQREALVLKDASRALNLLGSIYATLYRHACYTFTLLVKTTCKHSKFAENFTINIIIIIIIIIIINIGIIIYYH